MHYIVIYNARFLFFNIVQMVEKVFKTLHMIADIFNTKTRDGFTSLQLAQLNKRYEFLIFY